MANWQTYTVVVVALYLISTFTVVRLRWKESDEKYSLSNNNIRKRRLLHWAIGAICTIISVAFWFLTYATDHTAEPKPMPDPGPVVNILGVIILAVLVVIHALSLKCFFAAKDDTSEFM